MPSTAAAASPQASLPIAVGPNDPGFVAGTVAQPRTIAIAVNDLLLFAPNVIHVQQGETIAFAITNTGQAVHEFMVGPLAAAVAAGGGSPEV
ncbi:MAG: cupredoxin domain-containing protein, partial [Chloroflexi bacterium]|nr:cupredoxin domain-containing protein [Chloroflexota bacterium]